MRARSSSFYVKHSPFNKVDGSGNVIFDLNVPLHSLASSGRKITEEECLTLFEDFGPLDDSEAKDLFKEEVQNPFEESTESTAGSPSLVGNRSKASSYMESDDLFGEEPKVHKIFRGMIIGTKGSGRHTLLKMIYPDLDSQEELFESRQEFDLVTRKVETEERVERFHFWIKEVQERKFTYEPVFSAYYKTCSAFFLVYNVNDRKSFEKLEKEIKLIREVNSKRDIQLVLVGNRRSDGKCEVNSGEAVHLKEKYNINLIFESEFSLETSENLKGIIEGLMK